MSITTGYLTSTGVDIGTLFAAGSSAITTGYLNSTGVDIGTLFAPYQTWKKVVTGTQVFNLPIWAIDAYDSTHIYVGGQFTTPYPYITMFNGTSFTQMGTALNTYVLTINAIDPSHVFFGGAFTYYVAMWNGSSWATITSPPNAIVRCISSYDLTNVYIGGDFTSPFNGITRYNFYNNTWNNFGTISGGSTYRVNAIAVYDLSNVFIGGTYTSIDTKVGNFSRWDGSVWNACGTTNNRLYTISIYDLTHVYVGTIAAYFGMWNGSTLTKSSKTFTGSMYYMYAKDPSNVYIGGINLVIGGVAIRACIWNSNTDSITSISLTGSGVNAIEPLKYSNDIYFGGDFTAIGGLTTKNIAKYG